MEIKEDKRTPRTLRKQYSIDAPNIVSACVCFFICIWQHWWLFSRMLLGRELLWTRIRTWRSCVTPDDPAPRRPRCKTAITNPCPLDTRLEVQCLDHVQCDQPMCQTNTGHYRYKWDSLLHVMAVPCCYALSYSIWVRPTWSTTIALANDPNKRDGHLHPVWLHLPHFTCQQPSSWTSRLNRLVIFASQGLEDQDWQK